MENKGQSDPDTIEPAQTRIRYADDVEQRPRRGRARSGSQDSMSVRSRSLSRRRTIEPNVVLPVQYRTV